MDDVESLVFSPFKEIVEKATTAAENAKAAPDASEMLKAANGLVRSAERAVSKIAPKCQKHFETYGLNFFDFVRDNEDIATCRRELNDFLWEFDDYMEVDDFDADKYKELQSLIRKCAPKIEETLIRMKLEPVAQAPDDPLNKLGAIGGEPSGEAPVVAGSGLGIEPGAVSETQSATTMGAQSGPDLGLQGTPSLPSTPAVETQQLPSRNESVCSMVAPPPPPPPQQPPPFPQDSPWKTGVYIQAEVDQPEGGVEYQRRDPIPPSPPRAPEPDNSLDSHVQVATSEQQDDHRRHLPSASRAYSPSQTQTPQHQAAGTISANAGSPQYGQVAFTQLPSPISPVAATMAAMQINVPGPQTQMQAQTPTQMQSHEPPRAASGEPGRSQPMSYLPVFQGAHGGLEGPSLGHMGTVSGRDAVRHSRDSSITDVRRDSGYGANSPSNASHRASSVMSSPDGGSHSPHSTHSALFAVAAAAAAAGAPGLSPHHLHHSPQHFYQSPAMVGQQPPTPTGHFAQAMATEQPGLEHIGGTCPPVQEFETGLIPVDMENVQGVVPAAPTPAVLAREPDCTIGPGSSFQLLKGFCPGAKEALRGSGEGIKQVPKLNFGTGAVNAAKCKSCMYELEWSEVEADRAGQASANYVSKSSGVGFRVRFLIKSHLPARSVDDQVYACLFCVQLGRTIEESDATVFFSQKALLSHIARHPRPLPIVPGLDVIQATEIPTTLRNNYDLHLSQPPRISVTSNLAREIDMLPMAIAVDTVKQTYGTLKLPPDRATALQFAAGAKIVGIEFPLKYNGEWAVGWSDGTRAAFPASAARLEPPPRSQIIVQGVGGLGGVGGSGMRAVARWKFNNKDKERGDWLKLEKNEVISNIAWASPAHWCWSGTNSKGKWGIFPQSHVDSNSIREEGGGGGGVASSGASVMTTMAPGGDRASIASTERRRSGIFSRIASRARPGSMSAGSSSGGGGNNFDGPRPSIY